MNSEIRHPEFQRRLLRALDFNRMQIPDKGVGRNEEVARRLREQWGVPGSTSESVSKWTKGVTKPRPETMAALARVLGVDLAWLDSGVGGDGPVHREYNPKEPLKPATPAPSQARSTHLFSPHEAPVVGLAKVAFELMGATIEPTTRAHGHFYAAFGPGFTLLIHAVLARAVEGGGWEAELPLAVAGNAMVMVVAPETPTSFKIVWLSRLNAENAAEIGKVEGDTLSLRIAPDLSSGAMKWTEFKGLDAATLAAV